MSSRKKVSPKEVEVIETATEVVEEEIEEVDTSTEITEAEEVQEEKPKKSFIKRWWPLFVGGGVAIAAFFAGKVSGSNDEAALAALEHEYGDGKEQDESDTLTEEESDDTPEDTEKTEENT